MLHQENYSKCPIKHPEGAAFSAKEAINITKMVCVIFIEPKLGFLEPRKRGVGGHLLGTGRLN